MKPPASKRLLIFALLLCACLPACASQRIDLDGAGWTFKTATSDGPVAVSVPSSWLTMDGYRSFIGDGMYDRDFQSPTLQPGQIIRLHFDAVYDVANVWLNGHFLGTHDGGYTPFEFDVTKLLVPGTNHLTVEASNVPTLTTTIPTLATSHGSQRSDNFGSASNATIVGWMPYGGIVRPVSLLITDAVYIRNVKVDAQPDLTTGTATLKVQLWLHNGGATAIDSAPQGSIAGITISFPPTHVAAGSDVVLHWSSSLSRAHLWSVKDPFLYQASVQVPGDQWSSSIGVRDIRVQGTQLLLNGTPVHLFGANRVSEDPKEGLRESPAIIDRDLSDMLADNMRMMRIAHYPQAPDLLDFADKHGMLIIAEAGNWDLGAWQMADSGLRALWKQQMQEMMREDWNHPSVIAWSVGNEYESYTPQGLAWTRDMRAYTLKVDPTRLITFASRFTSDPAVKTGKDEASQYSDFVSINIYGNYAQRFDHAHELYPDKPIFVTEFGKMGEPGLEDPLRIQDISEAVAAVKARPWMIGASLWTWADYRSLFHGTPPNGIRNWGVVTFDRQHRDSWSAVQKLFKTDLP
ncbi:glycoside hydrolase family 2 protein [Granulicella sp. L46]|uniref:glycoside hydrolase family 2 protein n=1 Tax=Granulicella sp. L46 TaxID=1641865 RepID=UPI00131BE7DF|nr:glycoside hydrolase family 2 TIM barrel-domain containing protein [Granulicella sp. L46]